MSLHRKVRLNIDHWMKIRFDDKHQQMRLEAGNENCRTTKQIYQINQRSVFYLIDAPPRTRSALSRRNIVFELLAKKFIYITSKHHILLVHFLRKAKKLIFFFFCKKVDVEKN